MCEKRLFAQRHPEKYAYANLRTNAKRRGKYFDLTFEQFMKFVNKSGYMELKGRGALCLTIDRIKNELGYTYKNIRAILLIENVFKRNYVDFRRKDKKKYSHEEAKALAGTPF